VETLASPQELRVKLEQILRDAGHQDNHLVQVSSAPVGGRARYVVNAMRGEARLTLTGALEQILHRPLIGAHWILNLDEVRTITAAESKRVRQAGVTS
jgi:hypothetical protein